MLNTEIASSSPTPRNDTILIEGAGIAGQVLCRELALKGIAARLVDRASFPREKVCGGVLQWDSWDYLRTRFDLKEPVKTIGRLSHFWRGKKIAAYALPEPMVYISRKTLDSALFLRQETPKNTDSAELFINARGAEAESGGDWLGFQSQVSPVDDLQMHYGRGICAGISPTMEETESHLAFIVKRGRFQGQEDLKRYLWEELKIKTDEPLKGTGRIRYGYSKGPLAVGDAKMTTFPFLGLGMKHAILSARLLADKISKKETGSYDLEHQKNFRKYRLFSQCVGRVYDSPFQGALRPFIQNRSLFMGLYRWLHGTI